MSAEQTSLIPTTQNPPAQVQQAAMMAATSTAVDDYSQYLDYNRYNPIFFTQAVLDYLPRGVRMVPQLLEIPERDLWTKEKASFLKQGDAMLSANAINRIGKAAGVTLERVTDKTYTVKDPQGKEQTVLLIEYKASMMLPDGTPVSDIGGKEELYTPGVQHSREKTDTKARRNAMRRLLDVPLTMPRSDFDKPMVVWKAVYERGGEMDHVLDAIEARKVSAIKMLYPGAGQTVDVQAEAVDTADSLRAAIDSAASHEDLEAVGNRIANTRITQAERVELQALYKARKVALSTPDGGGY